MIIWQEPPPYVQYMQEAEALGRASYLAGVCTRFGVITADQDAMQEMVVDLYRRATIDRAEGPQLVEAVQSGSDRERAAVELMLDLGADDGSERRRQREARAGEYFGTGCADLTIKYPAAFQWVQSSR